MLCSNRMQTDQARHAAGAAAAANGPAPQPAANGSAASADASASAGGAAAATPSISLSDRLAQLTALDAHVDGIFQRARTLVARRLELNEACVELQTVHVAYRPDGQHTLAELSVRADAAKIRDEVCAVEIRLTAEAVSVGAAGAAASEERLPSSNPPFFRTRSTAAESVQLMYEAVAAFRALAQEVVRDMSAARSQLHALGNPRPVLASMPGGQAMVARVDDIRGRLDGITLRVFAAAHPEPEAAAVAVAESVFPLSVVARLYAVEFMRRFEQSTTMHSLRELARFLSQTHLHLPPPEYIILILF